MKRLRKKHLLAQCNGCGTLLTLAEQAFNETLCDLCQYDVNAQAFQVLSKIMNDKSNKN